MNVETGKVPGQARKPAPLLVRLLRQKELQLMVIPGILLIIVFRFFPIYGLQIAFKELNPVLGVWGSPWIGWKNFHDFIFSPVFANVMYNTIMISLLKLAFTFPVPILFALLLNELRSGKARTLFQGISYLPHFMSWVICAGVFASIFAKDGGTLNNLLLAVGLISEPIHFMGEPKLFWPILIVLQNWKEMGWSAIIFMAAIVGIDSEIYDSAKIDGANRYQQMFSITLPCILPTVAILLILRVGHILDAGFDQILVFRNPLVADVANIIDTHVLDTGIQHGRFGYATAVGMFKSVIGFLLILLSNHFARKQNMGIW